MSIRKALLSPLYAAFCMVAFSPVFAAPVAGPNGQIQDHALQQQLQQINALARSKNVVLKDLQVHRSVQLGTSSNGMMTAADSGTSCTVTAQVIIMGVGATVSATAPTCEQAAAMIASYVRSIGPQ